MKDDETEKMYALAYKTILFDYMKGDLSFSNILLEYLPYDYLCKLIQKLTKTTGIPFELEMVWFKNPSYRTYTITKVAVHAVWY